MKLQSLYCATALVTACLQLPAQPVASPDLLQVYQDSVDIQPVIHGDFADPSVIRVGQVYYAAGTSSEWAPHYPLYKSTDLIHWQQQRAVFDRLPDWTSSSFWAPELLYRDGLYYLYYTARRKKDGVSCIGVATSKDPATGFRDRGIVVAYGKEAIDAFVIQDQGKWYITFKAYGLDPQPIALLGLELSADGCSTVGEAFELLRDDQNKGMEGQCIVKRDGYFYLFYSSGGCCGAGCSYEVNVLRSRQLKGPYTSYAANPVLSATNDWKCTGHGTVVTSPEGRDFYLFHAYRRSSDVYTGRQGMLAGINWNQPGGWPAFQWISGTPVKPFTDQFDSAALNPVWQWDFQHTDPRVILKEGQLHLSGKTTANNQVGTALTITPKTGDYEMITSLRQPGGGLKGLLVYADVNESIGIGLSNRHIEIWSVSKGVRKTEKTIYIDKKATDKVELKMKTSGLNRYSWFYRIGNSDWTLIQLSTPPDKLQPAWDRSPRIGLFQKGETPAVFDFFKVRYF